jgi:hypothetical protein
MQDVLIGGAWAVILARGGDDAALALAAPKPSVTMTPTVEGRLMRFAATHPVEAITRALSVEWLMRKGLGEAALRAEAWKAFGDAPLDVVDREVHPQRHERNTFHHEEKTEGALKKP